MVNFLKIKKFVAFFFSGLLPLLVYFLVLSFTRDFVYSLAGAVLTSLICMFVGSWFTKHPFTAMMEGEGFLGITLDSGGVMQPFILKIKKPYVEGKLNDKDVLTAFDRKLAHYLRPPKYAEAIEKDDVITLEIKKTGFQDSYFRMENFLCFIYNEQTESFITKGYLANIEKESFTLHNLLYLKKKTEDLGHNVHNFAKYVVNLLKPQQSFIGSTMFWVILIVVIGGVLLLFGPDIMKAIGLGGDSLVKSGSQIAQNPNGFVPTNTVVKG